MAEDKKPQPDESRQFPESDHSKTFHGNLSDRPPAPATHTPQPPPPTYYLPEQPKRPKEK
jgi:hypothetical protein